MTLQVAKSAGFCAGVAHAVNTVIKEAGHTEKQYGGEAGFCEAEPTKCRPIATLGPLAHNRIVTDGLARIGVRVINSHLEAQGETVAIRAHGIPPWVEEDMIKRGIPYIDCTCTCVKAVHRRAAKAREAGRTVIILGEAGHPEIIGIVGYLVEGDFFVVSDSSKISEKLVRNLKYTLIAQTTFERAEFEKAAEILRKYSSDAVIFDTLCDATSKRYAEAEALSKQMDVMLVLGDEKSANTNRLYQIAKKYCQRTYLLACIQDLELPILRTGDKIGLTAGASTPPAITKEAIQFMSTITNTVEIPEATVQSAQSFEEMLNESFMSLHTGDIVKGTVISVTPTEVTVNLGYKSDGIISRNEMTDDPSVDITQVVKTGDVFDVYVLRVNDGDGNVQVSKKKLDNQVHYKTLEQAFIDKAVLPGRIAEVVKGGLIAMIENCRVFVPSSQISNRYVDDLTTFKGKELNFNILEFDRAKRRIVAGRKDLANKEQQQRRDELYATLSIGQRIEGTVSRIVDFGAFVDLGGVDGLVHISELAWKRVRKVTDVIQVGDSVTVTVIDINPEKNKISLSLKDINSNPWNNVSEKYPIGSIVEGKVVRLAAFGAFVMLEEGLDGLVHISQIADKHVAKPEDELTVGEMIQVKITDVDEENRKISLSKREADIALGFVPQTEEVAKEPEEAIVEESTAVEEAVDEKPENTMAEEATVEEETTEA